MRRDTAVQLAVPDPRTLAAKWLDNAVSTADSDDVSRGSCAQVTPLAAHHRIDCGYGLGMAVLKTVLWPLAVEGWKNERRTEKGAGAWMV